MDSHFKFDGLIPYSTDSFAFPLHVQQGFFVDDGGNDGCISCIILSKVDGGPHLQAVQIGTDVEYHGLKDICTNIDNTHGSHVLARCRVLIVEDVSKALEIMEEDPHCEDNFSEH